MRSELAAGVAELDDLMERLERGEFDLVAVGRALISDPEWATKIMQHRYGELVGFDRNTQYGALLNAYVKASWNYETNLTDENVYHVVNFLSFIYDAHHNKLHFNKTKQKQHGNSIR